MSNGILVMNEEIQLEQEVLGNIFRNNGLLLEAKEIIKDYMFSIQYHRLIYKNIINMVSKGFEVDSINFIGYYKEVIREMGGIGYITEISNCITHRNIKTKLELMVSNYHKRLLLELKENLDYEKSQDEMLRIVEDTLKSLYDSKIRANSIDLDKIYEDYLNNLYEDKGIGYKSGFIKLDKVIGKLQPQRLITVFARSGVGKSTLAIQIALNMAMGGYRVIYGSAEMSNAEVFNKMAASKLNIPYCKFINRQLSEDEKTAVSSFISELNSKGLYISNETDIEKLISEIKLCKLKYGLDVVFVDYVNKYLGNFKGMTLTEKIGQVTARLKDLALQENICVVLLAQANRKADSNIGELIAEKITEADIQDSARIEQDSDQLLALYRNKKLDNKSFREEMYREGKLDYNSPNAEVNPYVININIVKNRHGERSTLWLKWDPEYSRVREEYSFK